MKDSPMLNEKQTTRRRAKGLRDMLSLKRSTTTQDGDGAQQDTQTLKEEKAYCIIQSIRDLPLEKFIACAVDGDYTVLGDAPAELLYKAWLKIISEYHTARGDEEANRLLEIMCTMEALNMRAIWIDYVITDMERLYIAELAQQMREEFPSYEFSTETYLTDMKKVRSMEKRNAMRYEELQAELEGIERTREANASGKNGRTDYLELLLDINKHEHAHYDLSMSTELFALCLKRLQEYNQKLKNNQQDYGSGGSY